MARSTDKKTTKILSFVGGLLIFSVIVGVAVNNNESIKKEVERQITGFLGTSKKLLGCYEGVTQKLSEVSRLLKNDNANHNLIEENEPALKNEADSTYDRLWESI
ncbi:MAG: hypothetical protein LBU48_00310 [Coriobacteriales bacterium]|jgi:CHASE3 domain sensor protein|nr:hypothetical protein [Coriobacteriales bacterium]